MATEKRLSDANAFLRETFFQEGIYPHEQLRKEIEKAPTVDAVEVVHGQWVNPYMNRYGHPCHCCSVCGFKASYQDKNYCPNCGAKMDGGTHETD